MKFFRVGHLKVVASLKVGDTLRRGDRIGDNSTGNGQWAAHAHFDILTYQPTKWTEYVIGWSLEKVRSHYADPRGLEKVVLPTFHHLGYGWLENAQYAGGKAFHPGLDLNGAGSGNADAGDPLYSPCTGVIRYIYHGTGKNEGWGGLIVIEEKSIEEVVPVVCEPMKKEFVEAIKKLVGKDYGDTINADEQLDATKRIEEKRMKLAEQEALILSLNDSIRTQKATIDARDASLRTNATTIDSLRADIQKLQSSLAEKSVEIEALKKKITTDTSTKPTQPSPVTNTKNPTEKPVTTSSLKTSTFWESLLRTFRGDK